MSHLGKIIYISDSRFEQVFGPFPKGVLVYVSKAEGNRLCSYWVTRQQFIRTFAGGHIQASCQPILLSNKVSSLTRSRKVIERAAKLQITPEEYTSICEFCRAHQAIMA